MTAAAPLEIDLPVGRIALVSDGDESSDALVVLAHGAGAAMNSEFMAVVSSGLASEGLRVWRFNFPYAQAGRKAPDKQATLEATWTEVARLAEVEAPGRAVILGGKSMGGRVASQVVAAGLLFLGYPLHPPGKPQQLRFDHLRSISVRMLFVAGTRDPFCPLSTLREAIEQIPAPVALEVIEGGDHSFKVPKSSGRTTAETWACIPSLVAVWVRTMSPSRTG
jgi:predicted alpha/beta-hydrolase family hydrolase